MVNKDKAVAVAVTVLQVIPRLDAGGVERGVIEIARAIKAAGYRSLVCSAGGKLVCELQGIEHITLPVDSKNPLTMIRNISSLRAAIRKYAVNIVHVRSRAPAWSCLFACRLEKVKMITTFHGTYGAKYWLKRLYNTVMLRSDKVIAISPFIFEHIRDVYNHNMRNVVVINRGVDIEEFDPSKISAKRLEAANAHLKGAASPPRTDLPILLMPGRFSRWKGHTYLLEILKILQHRNYQCYMVGECTPMHQQYMAELMDKIVRYQLKDSVFIRPHYGDMAALYAASDIVLSMSQEPEAFGRTIVEAQSMGKVVLATEHGGSLYTIANGQTGYHLPIHEPEAAAAILKEVLAQSPEQRRELGKHAAELTRDNYAIAKMCGKTLKIYHELYS